MSLFDHFPLEEQQRQLASWVVPGAIVRLHCSWVMKADKNKFLVIGATQSECLLLMVNTDLRRAPLLQTQVELSVADYPTGFTTNCFIDCSTVVTQITYDGVTQQLQHDGSRYRGQLTVEDRREVVAAVKFASDISPVYQDMIYEALADAA